jgi:hypothetical protein
MRSKLWPDETRRDGTGRQVQSAAAWLQAACRFEILPLHEVKHSHPWFPFLALGFGRGFVILAPVSGGLSRPVRGWWRAPIWEQAPPTSSPCRPCRRIETLVHCCCPATPARFQPHRNLGRATNAGRSLRAGVAAVADAPTPARCPVGLFTSRHRFSTTGSFIAI